MKKKYFTSEEKRLTKNLQQKIYYNKIKKLKLSPEEKEKLRLEKKEKKRKYLKEYYLKNKRKISENSREYFQKNKEKRLKQNNDRYKKRRAEEPIYKLITNLKRNIRAVIVKQRLNKKSKTLVILGCSYQEFKLHLQSQFEPWMNWSNYGLYNGDVNYGWDIDHIMPLSSAKTEEEIIKLNHYANLRPLCSFVNRVVKRDNVLTVVKNNSNISSIKLN
jgi:hypothetical protein